MEVSDFTDTVQDLQGHCRWVFWMLSDTRHVKKEKKWWAAMGMKNIPLPTLVLSLLESSIYALKGLR